MQQEFSNYHEVEISEIDSRKNFLYLTLKLSEKQ